MLWETNVVKLSVRRVLDNVTRLAPVFLIMGTDVPPQHRLSCRNFPYPCVDHFVLPELQPQPFIQTVEQNPTDRFLAGFDARLATHPGP